MTTVRLAGIFATLVLAMASAGCNPQHDVPLTHPVSGQVTLDGKPLASGTILFEPTAPETLGTPPGSAQIVDGRYELQAPAGSHIVRITSPRETGETDETGIALTEEQVDEKFNAQSELTFDVTEGQNAKDFQVTTKTKKPAGR